MARRTLLALAVAFAVLAAVPWIREPLGVPVFYLAFGALVFFWVAQATSWNLLSGYTGYFSFGQGAFFGVGVYTSAVLSGRGGMDYFLTIPLAGIVAALLGLAVGGVAFRLRSLRGEIFALLTLAVPFILASFARINTAIDGGQGIVLRIPEFPEFLGGFQDLAYLLSLGVAGLAVGIAYVAQHSRFGWALFAIRDAENVAEGLGVPTFGYKMLAIGLSAALAGMAGSVFALQIGFVTVEGTFNLTVPLFVIVMSVLGGRMHWLGPALGALIIVTLQDRLAAQGFEGYSLIILGAILVSLVLLAPEGLMARLRPRLLPVVAAAGAVYLALAVTGVWGAPLDWFAVALVAAAVVAFWPRRRTVAAARAAALGGIAPVEEVEDEDLTDTAAPEALPTPPAERAIGRPIIEAHDLTRHFGGIRALDGISLTIHEGEVVGLVGPNGSGKTTLVNLLSGALRPTSGDIRIDGRSVLGLPAHRLAHAGAARTYQIPRPFGSMTVRDNVAIAIMFGREAASLATARREARQHLELVGLVRHADALPGEINLHERQLLEIARAIATRPRVLLLDEALAGLNPAEIDNAAGVVRRVHESGIAIVLVEHVLRIVNQLATRVVVLDQGRLLAEGEPADVMRNADVVRAYLGRRAHA
ncbi:MAG TPA: branched-chain amino acid ABC transporter ATP-binding protein/permease [Candidatus Limnocylindria bacterium]|nr:branched-chain amino acid ABC transporter ATP-binding protein/permease [Candidatus Limnocylindria bacterium]